MPKLDRNAAFNEAFSDEPKLDRAQAEKLAEDGGGLIDAGKELIRGTYQLADSAMGMVDRSFVGDLMRAVKGKPTSRDVDPIVADFLRLPKAEQERISSEYLNAGTPMQDAQAYFKNAAEEWAKKRSPSLQAAEEYTQQGQGLDILTRYAEEPSALAGALVRNIPQMLPMLLARKAPRQAQMDVGNVYQGGVGAQQARDQSLTDSEKSGASATDTVQAAQTAEDVGRGVSKFAGLFGARGDVAALNVITGRSLAPVLAGSKKELLKQPAKQATEEFIDESGSPLGTNLGAQQTYDPSRATMQNVVNQGIHGALVGGPMGIAQGASMAFGKRAQTPETAAANADALVSAINNAVGPIVQTRDTLKTQVDDLANQVKAFDEASANGQLNAADIARKQAILQELAAKQTELSAVETKAQDAAISASNDALKQYAQAGEVPDFNAMGERLGINPDDLSSLYDQHSTSIKQQQAATDTRNNVAKLIEANDTEGAQAFLEQNGFKQDQADVIMADAMKSITAKNKAVNDQKAAEAKKQAKLDAETKLRAERDADLAAIIKTKPNASFANDVLPILQKKYKLQSGSEALSVWNEAKKQSKAAPVDQQAAIPTPNDQTPTIDNTQAATDELTQHIEAKTRPDFIGLGKKYGVKPLTLDAQYREMLRVKKEQSMIAPSIAPVVPAEEQIIQPKPKQKADDKPIDPEKDSLLVALAKIGGLSLDEARSHRVDGSNFNHRPLFGKLLFRTDGKSFDSAAEALAQDNYPVFDDDQYNDAGLHGGNGRKSSGNALLLALTDALNGKDIGTPQYYNAKAQKAYEEAQEEARLEELFNGKGNSKADWLDDVSDAIVDELIENPSTATQEVIEVIQNDAGTETQDVTGNSQAETQPTADETSPPVSSQEATSQSESGGRESASSPQTDTGNVGDTNAPTPMSERANRHKAHIETDDGKHIYEGTTGDSSFHYLWNEDNDEVSLFRVKLLKNKDTGVVENHAISIVDPSTGKVIGHLTTGNKNLTDPTLIMSSTGLGSAVQHYAQDPATLTQSERDANVKDLTQKALAVRIKLQEQKIAMGEEMVVSKAKREKEQAELDRLKGLLTPKAPPTKPVEDDGIKTKNIKQPKPADKTVYPHRDDLLTAIAKMKGLNKAQAIYHGIKDRLDLNKRGRSLLGVFKDDGEGFDVVARKLSDMGYPVNEGGNTPYDNINGTPTTDALLDALRKALFGEDVGTEEYILNKYAAQREADQKEAEEMERLFNGKGSSTWDEADALDNVSDAIVNDITNVISTVAPEKLSETLKEVSNEPIIEIGGQAPNVKTEARSPQNGDAETTGNGKTGQQESQSSTGQDSGVGLNPSFNLNAQTNEELAKRDADNKAAEAKRQAEEKTAKDKAQADKEVSDFRLSGSNAPADIAMAGGQKDMFAPPTRGEREAEKAKQESTKEEPVKWFGSLPKAVEWVAKQKGQKFDIRQSNGRFEIYPAKEQAQDKSVQNNEPAPTKQPETKTEPKAKIDFSEASVKLEDALNKWEAIKKGDIVVTKSGRALIAQSDAKGKMSIRFKVREGSLEEALSVLNVTGNNKVSKMLSDRLQEQSKGALAKRLIGKTPEGKDLYEDGRGVRFTDNGRGVQVGEDVGITQQQGKTVYDVSGRTDEHRTVEEVAARQPKPQPKDSNEVIGYSDKHPSWATKHEKDVGGHIVYSNNDYALLEGFSVANGMPVYTFVSRKQDSRSVYDVESYTGKDLPSTDKDFLVSMKKQHMEESNKKHQLKPNLNFKDGQNVAHSDGVPVELADIATQWLKMLGIESKVFITTIEDTKGQKNADKYGFHGAYAAIRSAGVDPNEGGSTRRLSNGTHYIAIKLHPRMSSNLETLAHEIGHILEKETWKSADVSTKNAIISDFNKWVVTASSKNAKQWVRELRSHTTGKLTDIPNNANAAQLSSYWRSFSEYFADQVAKWATSSEQPRSVVDVFFSKLGGALKKFFASATGKDYLPANSMKKYLDELAQTNNPLQGSYKQQAEEKAEPKQPESKPTPTASTSSSDLTDEEYARLKKDYDDFKAKTDKIGVAYSRDEALKIATGLVAEMPDKEDKIRQALIDAIRENQWNRFEINFPKQPIKVETDVELNRALKRLQKALEGTDYTVNGTFNGKSAKLLFSYKSGANGSRESVIIDRINGKFTSYHVDFDNMSREVLKPLMDATVKWLNGEEIPKMKLGDDIKWDYTTLLSTPRHINNAFNEAKANAPTAAPVSKSDKLAQSYDEAKAKQQPAKEETPKQETNSKTPTLDKHNALMDSVGGTSEKLPDNSFMDSSLPVNTGVNARMVIIDKQDGDNQTNEYKPKFSRKATESDSVPIYRIDNKNFDANNIKPHGLYVSIPSDVSTFDSPHKDVGDTSFSGYASPKNPLNVESIKIQHKRGNNYPMETSAGVSALHQLVDKPLFDSLIKADKKELIATIKEQLPDIDTSQYHDAYELLEVLGAQLAIQDGYDAIIQKVEGDPMSEMVILDNAIIGSMSPLKSSTKNGGGLTTAQVRTTLVDHFGEKTVKALEDKGLVVIHANVSAVPKQFDAKQGDQGFYDPNTGITHLIAENLRAETVLPTMLHEMGGHAGFQAMLEPKLYDALMGTFNRLVEAGNPIAIEAQRRAEEAETNKTTQEMEKLPYLLTVAQQELQATNLQKSAITKLINRIISAVRAFAFEKLGIRLELTPSDMVALAERMIKVLASEANQINNTKGMLQKGIARREFLIGLGAISATLAAGGTINLLDQQIKNAQKESAKDSVNSLAQNTYKAIIEQMKKSDSFMRTITKASKAQVSTTGRKAAAFGLKKMQDIASSELDKLNALTYEDISTGYKNPEDSSVMSVKKSDVLKEANEFKKILQVNEAEIISVMNDAIAFVESIAGVKFDLLVINSTAPLPSTDILTRKAFNLSNYKSDLNAMVEDGQPRTVVIHPYTIANLVSKDDATRLHAFQTLTHELSHVLQNQQGKTLSTTLGVNIDIPVSVKRMVDRIINEMYQDSPYVNSEIESFSIGYAATKALQVKENKPITISEKELLNLISASIDSFNTPQEVMDSFYRKTDFVNTARFSRASNGQPSPSPTNPKLDRLLHGIGPGEKLFNALAQPIHKWLDDHSSSQWKLVNNMSPAFKQMMREYLRDQKASEEQTKSIVENGIAMSADERNLLSDVLEKMVASGTTIPQHIVQVAAAMRSALSGQTDELVRLGMLSEGSAERWRDTYLPRLYDKAAKDPINKALAKRLNIVGDHLKGRGIFREVEEKLEAKYEKLGWENRGKGKKGHVIMWRDYTYEERVKMGEIRDALHRFATGFLSTQRDIATGRLLEKIADNPDLASVDPVAGWTLVPTATIKETGGVKRYGKLSGMYVHPDVWENTKHYIDDRDGLMEFYRQTLSVWKQGKTALNLVAHMNNVVSNAVMVTAAGANMADVARGYDSMMKEDQYYKEAKELGMLASGHFTGDIRDYFGGDIQDATTPSNFVFKAFKAAWKNKGFEFMRKMYDAEDQLFRMALYRKARELGATQAESIDFAETFMFNYADLPTGIKKIRDFGLPFISYTYKAVPAVTRVALTHPHRVLALVGMVYAFNAIAYAMLGADADEDKERKNLPDYMQGYSAWGVPKLVRLPWNDGEKAAFLDVYRWAPLGDFFAVGNRTGGADVPTWAMMSGPYWSFYNTMIQNRNGLTGRNYLEDTDTDRQVFFKRMKFGLSEWVPMYYHVDKNLNAIRNTLGDTSASKLLENMGYTGTDMRGDPAELKNSLLGATGIKVRKLDMEDQKQRKLIAIKSEVLDRKRQINRIRKDQSNPYKERDIAAQVEEIKRLREKAQEIRNQ